MKRVLTRVAQLLLVVVVAATLLVVGRWLLAKSRVEAVAQQARVVAPERTKSATVAARKPLDGDGMSAADVAPMYIHAITQYRKRSASDLAALPPLGQPLTDAGAHQLKALADVGNARAACVLAAKVSKCTFWPEMGHKEIREREARLATLRQQGETGEEAETVERNVTGAKAMLARLATQCDGYSAPPEHTAWKYMLQSALQGFEPAMRQFYALPMFDPSDIGDSVDAFVAYKTYAGPFIVALAHSGDEFAMLMAHRGFGGLGAFGADLAVLRVLPRDPARALAYAYVRDELLRKRSELFPDQPASTAGGGSPAEAVARHEAETTAAERQWARQFADQQVASFDNRMLVPPPADRSDKDSADPFDWPEQFCRD